MSVTIGFGLMRSGGRLESLRGITELVDHHGYGYALGVDSIEEDSRQGVLQASANLGWSQVLVLRSPVDSQANLAFGIHQELQRQLQGERPRFFALLKDIAVYADDHKCDLDVFFCTEWCRGDAIRGNSGSIEQLITMLSLPGHWCQLYLQVFPGRVQYQESADEPFIFRVRDRMVDRMGQTKWGDPHP